MSVEFSAGRPAGLAKLRAGAALAMVLAAAAGALPAMAQSAPETADAVSVADDEQQQGRTAEVGASDERVYVLGRRVGSSVATLPDPDEAPQIINVISGETLLEQGVTSLEQALRNVPGITTQIGEGGVMSGDQFFIRGISAKNDIFTDGLRDFGVYTRDSFNYGQVEVFKGPSGAAFGRGSAGGGINTTSKTPFLETAGSATLAAGEGEYQRATVDWNQMLGDGIGVRVAAMIHHNENTGRDHVYSDRWGVAPSIGFGLDGDTTVTIAYLHQDEEKLTDYGIPVVNGVPVTEYGVDPTNFYGYHQDIDDTVVDTVTARLRHVANDWLTVTSDTRWGYYQRAARFTPVSCSGVCATNLTDNDPATIPIATPGGPGPWDQDTQGIQNITAAHVTAPIFGLESELVVGLDASWQQNDRNQYAYDGARAPFDLLNPVFAAGPPTTAARSNVRDTTTRDVALFANERLWFTEQWSVVGGVRVQSYEVDQNTTTFNTTSCNNVPLPTAQTCYTPVSSKSDFVTPQLGVIFEPSPNQQYYLNYASSAKPQGASTNNGDTISNPSAPGGVSNKDLDPEENTNIEFGARIGLFENRVQLQGAIFQTEKENAKIEDINGDLMAGSGDSQEIRGIELGVAGMITDQWSVNANATWLDTEITDSSPVNPGAALPGGGVCTPVAPRTTCDSPNIGNAVQFVPETGASLWTTYNFLGSLTGLEIGGGLTYQGEVYLNAQNTAAVPSYTTLDGLVSYSWDRFRISLNGYNLTDEVYFAQVHGNRVTPAQGRTFIATLGVVY